MAGGIDSREGLCGTATPSAPRPQADAIAIARERRRSAIQAVKDALVELDVANRRLDELTDAVRPTWADKQATSACGRERQPAEGGEQPE
jgi:hypothetical protein